MLNPGSHFRRRLSVYLVVATVIMFLAGGGFVAFESSQVPSFPDGLFWALSLMTTVGFVGDAPQTLGGRLASSVLMLSGFALMTLVTAAVASLFIREEQAPDEVSERAFERRALDMLEDLSRRLDAIEVAMNSESPDTADSPQRTTRP